MKLPPPPLYFVKHGFLIMLGAFGVILGEAIGALTAEHNRLVQTTNIETAHIQPVGPANTAIYIFIVTNTSQIRLNFHLKGQP
jgi:hypothetical protein